MHLHLLYGVRIAKTTNRKSNGNRPPTLRVRKSAPDHPSGYTSLRTRTPACGHRSPPIHPAAGSETGSGDLAKTTCGTPGNGQHNAHAYARPPSQTRMAKRAVGNRPAHAAAGTYKSGREGIRTSITVLAVCPEAPQASSGRQRLEHAGGCGGADSRGNSVMRKL